MRYRVKSSIPFCTVTNLFKAAGEIIDCPKLSYSLFNIFILIDAVSYIVVNIRSEPADILTFEKLYIGKSDIFNHFFIVIDHHHLERQMRLFI